MGVVRAVEAPPAGTVRFAIIGDYGSCRSQESDVALRVNNWKPHFVTTLGDNNYSAQVSDTNNQIIGRFYYTYMSSYNGSYGPGAAANRFFPIPGHRNWDHAALLPVSITLPCPATNATTISFALTPSL